MPSSVSCGTPTWCDGPVMTAQTPFRTYDVCTKVHNAGTAAANQCPSGVFPGNGAMAVTAPGGMNVSVSAGYCCVANSSSALQGGYIFGLMQSANLTVAPADVASPRIDLVCATVTDNGDPTSTSAVQVVTGVASGTPAVPALPANSTPLAQVLVAAGVSSVSASAVTDKRTWVVAPGGILPIANAAAAPAMPASQFMYDLSRNQLVQGTGTAGHVAVPGQLPWAGQLAVKTSNTLAASAGALTTVASVNVTTDGATDIEMYIKWGGVQGNADYITLGVYIDGTLSDSLNIESLDGTSFPTNGGSARFFTSSAQGNTPTAATHTVAWKFQAQGSGTSSSDGIVASSSMITMLRVSPLVAS